MLSPIVEDLQCFLICCTHQKSPSSISGLVVEYIVAIDVTRVRFPADACSAGPCRAGGCADWCLQAAVLTTEYVPHLHGCISDLLNGRCIQLVSWTGGRAGITQLIIKLLYSMNTLANN